jgi:CheY-like chemotaxis protein
VAKVLLVDDESAIRAMLRKLFERGGFEVREAESGREALEVVAADPDIAAVVSDYIMPELNGLELYDALVASNPRLASRVVFLTGAARDRTVHDLLEHRGVSLVSKLDDPQIVLTRCGWRCYGRGGNQRTGPYWPTLRLNRYCFPGAAFALHMS